tara:strand:- start:427 stop:1290 length:864 start_codon:yes stop_codon:yes gene_type:complete
MEKMTENTNPLHKYFRTPSIYVSLPCGATYDPKVLEMPQSGEIGVMPMTAKDEIIFKTPDALMNGQGVVDVIQSCIPAIKDAWQLKNYDLDTVLIAIRIATYGEMMDMNYTVPGTSVKVDHSLNLPALLENIKSVRIEDTITLKDGLKITVEPLVYKDITQTALTTFQQQKMFSQVSNSQAPDVEKTKKFNEAFNHLNELTTELMMKNISKITIPDGTVVEDKTQIKQFIENANAVMVNEITEKLADIRSQGSVKPLKMKATEEQIKIGAPANYDVPITFDTANFFV